MVENSASSKNKPENKAWKIWKAKKGLLSKQKQVHFLVQGVDFDG